MGVIPKFKITKSYLNYDRKMRRKFILFAMVFLGVVGLQSCEKLPDAGTDPEVKPEVGEFTTAKVQLTNDYPHYNVEDATWKIKDSYQVATFTAKTKSTTPEISVWYKVINETAHRRLDVLNCGITIPESIREAFTATTYANNTIWLIRDIELENRYDDGISASIYEVELISIASKHLRAELHFDAETGKMLFSKETISKEDDGEDRYVIDAALETAVRSEYPEAIIVDASKDNYGIEADVIIKPEVDSLEVEMLFALDLKYINSEYDIEYSKLPKQYSAINDWFVAMSHAHPAPAGSDEVEIVTGAEMTVSDIKYTSLITIEYKPELSDDDADEIEILFYLDGNNTIVKYETELAVEKYSNGTFILNEGNMSSDVGSLIFISANGSIDEDAYFTENGENLPWLTQDMFRSNNKLYIIGHSGDLVVVDAHTLKLIKKYNLSDYGLSSTQITTHLAVIDDNVFIRHGKNTGSASSISKFNLTTETITGIAATAYASNNRMVVLDDIIYSPAGNSVLVIKKDAEIAEVIKVPNDRQFITLRAADDGDLWVSGYGYYLDDSWSQKSDNAIMKMDVDTREFTSNIIPYNLRGSYFDQSPIIAALGNKVYFYDREFASTTRNILCHDFENRDPNTNTKMILEDINVHTEYKNGTTYNEIGINKQTKKLYVNMLKGFKNDYQTNDILIFNIKRDTLEFEKSYANKLHFPSAIQFTSNY